MKPKVVRCTIFACVVALTAFVGSYLYAATSNFLVSGATIEHSAFFDGPATMSVREFTVAPGETLPWHYHPGVVLVAVKSGTLVHEEGCGHEQIYGAGQAFEKFDHDVHRAKNLSSEPAVLYDTFITPAGQPLSVNIPNNERLCGPPVNIGSCRYGNWTNFTFPRVFNNQGDCEQWVITRK